MPNNETKFTKGEWVFNPHDGTITDDTKAANVISEVYTDDWHSLGEGIANAYLMKTSPKMYDMLEKIINLIENLPDNAIGEVEDTPDTQGWFIKDEVVHNIANLLAEARGEQ